MFIRAWRAPCGVRGRLVLFRMCFTAGGAGALAGDMEYTYLKDGSDEICGWLVSSQGYLKSSKLSTHTPGSEGRGRGSQGS